MISIIVPIYKVEKYLPKCIESLINQTKKDIEIILVDDGSPDRCPEICDEYAKKDSRIVVIHQPNRGVSAARNAGLNAAKGEFIGFVDPDDFVEKEMFEMLEEALKKSKSQLAVCGFNYIYENKYDEIKACFLSDCVYESAKCIEEIFNFEGEPIRPAVWNKLFIKSEMENMTFCQTFNISEDLLFLTQYLLKIESVAKVSGTLYNNVKREGSVTLGAAKSRQIQQTVKVDKIVYDMIKKEYPMIADTVLSWIIQDNMGWASTIKNNRLAVEKMKASMICLRFKGLFNKKTYWKTRLVYFLGAF